METERKLVCVREKVCANEEELAKVVGLAK